MNNTQLYLTIGIPSSVALISWITIILAWSSSKTGVREPEVRLSSKSIGSTAGSTFFAPR